MVESKKGKIIYLTETLDSGGSQCQCVETAIQFAQMTYDVKLYCLFGGGPLQAYVQQAKLDVTIFNIYRSKNTPKPFWKIRTFFAFYRYLKHEKPDIVHCFMYIPSLYGGIAAKMAGIPFLITSRRNLGTFKTNGGCLHALEWLVNYLSDIMIVNSDAVKQAVLLHERIHPAKIQLVYNGIDLKKYAPGVSNNKVTHIRKQKIALGIPENAQVIGMIANLRWCKGYAEFILAAAKVCRINPNAWFLCIGEDLGIQKQLTQLVDKQGLQERVIFTGQVEDVLTILPLLNIQVLASHEEGFPNALLEGMAMAKPLVATAVGGIPEALMHNQTGLLIPPQNPEALAQAILTLLKNPDLAKQFGANARKRVEQHFSLPIMLARLDLLYMQLYRSKQQ